MPWGRLDDRLNDDAKLSALTDSAFRLWVGGLVYSQKNLTDGFIPTHEIHNFKVRATNKAPLVKELCASLVIGKGPLWHQVDGGYQMHDYLTWNDSREKVLADRDLSNKRKERFYGRRGGRAQNAAVNASQDASENASRNAFQDADSTNVPERIPDAVLDGVSTYHVPDDQKQERADAPPHPVETVENRVVQFARRLRSRETSSGKPKIRTIAALVRALMTEYPEACDGWTDEGSVVNHVKAACGRKNLLYDSTSVGMAIDIARAQLRKRKDIPA